MKTHEDLEVWKSAINLSCQLFRITEQKFKSNYIDLGRHICKTSVSIPSNIAEGAARGSFKEYIRFCNIALGSAAELKTQLIIAEKLGIIDDNFIKNVDEIKFGIIGLRASLRKK